jgi:hypothetical protein
VDRIDSAPLGLTDEEREELSRKVAEANKRSENGGGR